MNKPIIDIEALKYGINQLVDEISLDVINFKEVGVKDIQWGSFPAHWCSRSFCETAPQSLSALRSNT